MELAYIRYVLDAAALEGQVPDDVRSLIRARIDNEHPEISWSALWDKVWYESREEPQYIWQSSSASSDFEPKFSLTPLA